MKISVREQRRYNNMVNTGVFLAFMSFSAIVFSFFFPIVTTNAQTNLQTEFSAVVNPVASITLDANTVDFNITPTSSGVFESKPIVANVSTNSTGGYELYFSSEDESADMANADSAVTDVIASDFSGTVTSSTMAANKWGYSLDNTDFSKIPVLSAQAKIRDLDHLPSSAEKETTVHIGTKIDDNLSAGTYSKTVKFSVVAHDTPEPPTPFPTELTTMQGMTSEICSAVGTGASTTLTDTRDSNTYTVKKLKDGRCWMTENLRIANKTITSADSNVTSDFTIPASSVSGFNAQDTNNAYVDSTYGGYYTFYTATAGTGGTSLTSNNAPSDICPKGWRLPTGGLTGGYSSEFNTLYEQYNSSALMQGDPGFILSGFVRNGSVNYQGSTGYYWSSSAGLDRAYYLILDSSDVNPGGLNYKYFGFSVRCIAR